MYSGDEYLGGYTAVKVKDHSLAFLALDEVEGRIAVSAVGVIDDYLMEHTSPDEIDERRGFLSGACLTLLAIGGVLDSEREAWRAEHLTEEVACTPATNTTTTT